VKRIPAWRKDFSGVHVGNRWDMKTGKVRFQTIDAITSQGTAVNRRRPVLNFRALAAADSPRRAIF
jgi:hypothetical protein